jgi:hypothetical protein
MGGEVGAVQASASAPLSSLSGLGNVAFGVGEYEDDPAISGQLTAITWWPAMKSSENERKPLMNVTRRLKAHTLSRSARKRKYWWNS